MTGIKINEDNIYPVLVAASLALAGLLAVVTALAISLRFGASVLAGGLLATANFCWLRRGLEAVLSFKEGGGASRFAVFRYLVRLAVMALLLYLLIVRLGADVIGLVLGLSVLVVTIVFFTIYLSTRKGG